MYYSDDIIEEVRSRNDIVDVIGGYVSLKKQGNSYSACCPFHHEKTPSFHVSRDKQLYHCFGCGASGNVFTFVREYENMGFVEAMKLLADRSGMTLPEYELSPKQKEQENYRTALKELNKTAAAYFHYLLTKTEHGKKALDYLHNRGFTDDTITAFAMGYSDIYNDDLYKYLKNKGYTDRQMVDAGLVDVYEDRGANDKFWNRVMVPILDINGKVIAFGGRVLGDAKPKYVNTKETAVFDKSRNLFAMNIARRSKRRGIIICEGYMDVIAMHQAGFDNAVASLGTAFTIGQANIIKRYTDEVYLAYDSDGAGTNATMKAIGIMRSAGITTRVIDMKPYKDPDEFIKNMGREAYEERILHASTGIMFEVACLAGSYNLKDPEEKTRFTKEAAKRISAIEEVVTRHSYIEAVAEQYRLDADGFKSMVTKYGTLGMKESEITNSAPRRTTQKQDDTNMPERLLLTWLVNDTGLFDVLSGIISEEDFVAEDYRAVADILFLQYRETGQVKPAAIVDMFPDMDKQRLVASILQTEFAFDMDLEEREKAVNDVVKRTKLAKIDYDMSMCMDDMTRLQELIKAKAKIAKLHISLKSG
ncbi:MAG: DNA primase [Clostridium sp.]|nr:DNA primase [Clostridium sp.]